MNPPELISMRSVLRKQPKRAATVSGVVQQRVVDNTPSPPGPSPNINVNNTTSAAIPRRPHTSWMKQQALGSGAHSSGSGRRWNHARIKLAGYQSRWNEIGLELPPQINRRHISVISIGGVIGTGLYIGTATALRHAGPVGTLLAYMVTGTVVWSVVISIGEIVAFLPNVGGPVGLAGLYVDPALGFALGWNAWYNWTIILPTELSAAAILVNGLFPNPTEEFIRHSNIVTITILLLLAVVMNCFGARAYGEIEFLFSCFKIFTITALILAGIILDAGGGKQGYIGFRNWRECGDLQACPGPFVAFRANGTLGQFLGFWSSMSQAVFAFFGTEIPGVAAGEVQNPAKNIPRAINRVWIRITLFYVLAVFVAGLLVKSNDEALLGPSSANPGRNLVLSSPFVIALRHSYLNHLDLVCNVAFVVSAFSAAVSDVYISSRLLYYLARCGHAPAFCANVIRSRRTVVPWVGISVASAFALLAYMSIFNAGAENVFHWLSSMTSTTALLSWIGMLFTYLRWYQGTRAAERKDRDFKKNHKEDLYKNRYRLQPWIAIYALVMCILILIFNGWFVFTRTGPWIMAYELGDSPLIPDAEIGDWVPIFISSYLPIPAFVLGFIGYKLIYRTKMVPVEAMQFERGHISEIIEELPTTLWGKLLAIIF